MMRDMSWRRLAKGQRRGSERCDDRIDDVEDRLRRAEARGDREVAKLTRPLFVGEERVLALAEGIRALFERLSRLPKTLGIGALETIDRLLEISDHEERTEPLFDLAGTAEELFDQPLDNLTLRGVGVLGLVHQVMVDLPVELVADPVAHSGQRQQPAGPVDEV